MVRAVEEVKEVVKAKDNTLETTSNNPLLVKSYYTQGTAMVDPALAGLVNIQEYTVVLLLEFDSPSDHASPPTYLFAYRASL